MLYSNNKCHARIGGKSISLYVLASGIIQGCPLSGSVFVIVVDTFLNLLGFQAFQTICKAFADDIGCLMKKLFQLIPIGLRGLQQDLWPLPETQEVCHSGHIQPSH